MNDNVAYSINQSSVADIAAHLLNADATFKPSLSSRVEIRAYAEKLHGKAVRFEAWSGEELVGLVAGYCNQPNWGKSFVTSVSVLPKSQGLGIAGQLMQQCIEHMQGLGFAQMELEVDLHSLPAVSLYKRLGFATLRSSGSVLTMGMTLGKKAI
jgi:ribosomal protein S18 acetylase RimI-like enzyme